MDIRRISFGANYQLLILEVCFRLPSLFRINVGSASGRTLLGRYVHLGRTRRPSGRFIAGDLLIRMSATYGSFSLNGYSKIDWKINSSALKSTPNSNSHNNRANINLQYSSAVYRFAATRKAVKFMSVHDWTVQRQPRSSSVHPEL
jgi:hypothetical protein